MSVVSCSGGNTVPTWKRNPNGSGWLAGPGSRGAIQSSLFLKGQEGPGAGAGGEGSSLEERGAAKTGCDELMAAPVPCAPVREQGQNSGRWVQDLNSLK